MRQFPSEVRSTHRQLDSVDIQLIPVEVQTASGMTPAAEVVVPTRPPMDTSAINQILRSGDTSLLLKLLSDEDVGNINVNVFDREGMTPLHKSVMDGNFELVKLLVEVGADVRLASRDGWSALHIASFGGHVNIVDYLINCSVRPRA